MAFGGEVEDYRVHLDTPTDWGDAPSSYGTDLGMNGARHGLVDGGPRLGALVDGEVDGLPTIGADGDDRSGFSDEDGVTFLTPLVPGMPAEILTDSRPDRPYKGHVGFISPEAEFTPKNVETPRLRTDLVFRLRVVADNPDEGLRQGMPVTVTLDTSKPPPERGQGSGS